MGNSVQHRENVANHFLEDYPQTFLSFHTGDPGETGASEVKGGGYKRQLVEWLHVRGGTLVNRNELPFDRLPKATITHWGLWDAERDGTYITGWAWSRDEVVSEGDKRFVRDAELAMRMG